MKTNKRYGILALMAMAMATLATAWAEPPPLAAWGGVGSGPGANSKSNYVVSANARNGGTAVVTYLHAISSTATDTIDFWQPTATRVLVTAANTNAVIPVTQTNGFSSGDWIVIRHKATDTYSVRILTTMAASPLLTTTANPLTCAAGDVVYKMERAGSITIGSTTVPLTISAPGGFYFAQREGPLLLTLTSASATLLGINAVSGFYATP